VELNPQTDKPDTATAPSDNGEFFLDGISIGALLLTVAFASGYSTSGYWGCSGVLAGLPQWILGTNIWPDLRQMPPFFVVSVDILDKPPNF